MYHKHVCSCVSDALTNKRGWGGRMSAALFTAKTRKASQKLKVDKNHPAVNQKAATISN